MQKIYRFIISGLVHGVGFRFSVLEYAKSRKLLGTVKNNINGTVEINFFGTQSQKKSFEEFCKKNPGWSHVNKIEIQEITNEVKANEFQKLDGFKIIY